MNKSLLSSHRIAFESMDWTHSDTGVRFKAYQNGNQRIRLVEFSEGFVEPDWCTKGHACYVLEGEFATDYNGTVERHKQGDICFTPAGEKDKHKAILGKGERVLLLLFEIVEE